MSKKIIYVERDTTRDHYHASGGYGSGGGGGGGLGVGCSVMLMIACVILGLVSLAFLSSGWGIAGLIIAVLYFFGALAEMSEK